MSDVYERSPDAQYILDSEFFEEIGAAADVLAWRECEIPVEEFCLQEKFEQHFEKLVLGGARALEAYEQERYAAIRDWMEGAGGPDVALKRSPLLVTIRNGKVTLEDGYHRLGLAAFKFGAKTVTALCAHPAIHLAAQEPAAFG